MRKLYQKLKNKEGFSLVELVIVIAIMAILIAILVPQFIKYIERSRVAKDETNADEILRAVQIALSDEKLYMEVTGSTTVAYSNAVEASNYGNGAIRFGNNIGVNFKREIADTLKLSDAYIGSNSNGGYIMDKKLQLASKLYVNQTYTITITISNGEIKVLDGWSSNK